MRIGFLILNLFLISLSGFSQNAYNIKVKVKGFQGDQAFLAYHFGSKQYIRDTVKVSPGQWIIFKGEEPLERGIYLVVLPPKNNYFEIVVSDDQEFSMETDTADFVSNMKVSGSEENEIFFKDLRFLAGQRKKVEALSAQKDTLEKGSLAYAKMENELEDVDRAVKSYRKALIRQHPNFLYAKLLSAMEEPVVPDAPVINGVKDSLFPFYYYRSHFLDGVDFREEGLVRTPIFLSKLDRYVDQLTVKDPDSVIVAVDLLTEKASVNDVMFQNTVIHLLNKYAKSDIMGMDAVYVHMVEQFYMSGKAFWADSAAIAKMTERALAISPTLIGKPAPNLIMQDMNGKTVNMYNVPAEYTILYFWDYDCGHCKKVTPKVAELYKKYAGKNVALYAVSINGDQEVWKKKIAEYGLTGIQVQDHYRRTGFDKMYDIRSTPRIFLLDKDKKILAKYISVEQLEELLERFRGDKQN